MVCSSLIVLGVIGVAAGIIIKDEDVEAIKKTEERYHAHYEPQKITTKKVTKSYPVEVKKPSLYKVKTPVDKPNIDYREKKVPYQVKAPVLKHYTVEKKVPTEVKVKAVPNPVEVPKLNMHLVEEKIPYKVKEDVEKPNTDQNSFEILYPVMENGNETPDNSIILHFLKPKELISEKLIVGTSSDSFPNQENSKIGSDISYSNGVTNEFPTSKQAIWRIYKGHTFKFENFQYHPMPSDGYIFENKAYE